MPKNTLSLLNGFSNIGEGRKNTGNLSLVKMNREKKLDLINWIRACIGVVFFFVWGINGFWLPKFIIDIMNINFLS